jgi:hypothetical protein
MYITALEPISKAFVINPPISLCVCMCICIFARQRLCKNFNAAMNTHATIEELLDASFSMRAVHYQRKIIE